MKNVKNLRVVFAAFLLVVPTLAFSSQDRKMKLKLFNKTTDMKREIKKYIPVGTPIESARRVMESNGFKCQLMKGAEFEESGETGPVIANYHGIDFLYCDKERGGLICDRRWQIAIVHKDGMVSDVLVSIGRICL